MPPTHDKYAKKAPRKPVNSPHVSLRALRTAMGLTLDQIIARVQQEAPGQFPSLSRGTLTAIEKGYRGASGPMLRALALAYGLEDGDITTDYVPRGREIDGAA